MKKLQVGRKKVSNVLKINFKIPKRYHDKHKTTVKFETGKKDLMKIVNFNTNLMNFIK